jgi:KUP system potassium uptake protein
LIGFLLIDLSDLGSKLLTVPGGGWLPLVVGSVMFTVRVTWRRGAQLLDEQLARATPKLGTIIGRLKGEATPRVPARRSPWPAA